MVFCAQHAATTAAAEYQCPPCYREEWTNFFNVQITSQLMDTHIWKLVEGRRLLGRYVKGTLEVFQVANQCNPSVYKGSLFLATFHPGVGCRQKTNMGDTIACISSLSQKVLSALFTVQIIFHITTVKKTVRGLKALGYLFSIFWTCILAIKGHRMLLSQTSREDAFILQARNTHGS